MPKVVRKMQKANAAAQARVLPKIPPELLDGLVKGPMTAEAVNEAGQAFKKALIERALPTQIGLSPSPNPFQAHSSLESPAPLQAHSSLDKTTACAQR